MVLPRRCGNTGDTFSKKTAGLARSTEQLEAMYIFGSFVTAKTAPRPRSLPGRCRVTLRVTPLKDVLVSCSTGVGAAMVGELHLLITARTDRAPFLAAWQLRRRWRTTRYCGGTVVITNDQELAVTQQRIRQFHELLQYAVLRAAR